MKRPAALGGEPVFETLLPIVRPKLPGHEELEKDYRNVLASGMLTNGKYVRALEEALSKALEVPHVICVQSCTSALMLFLRGLEITGEVIVPSFTFMASAAAIVWAGCTPVFVDVDEHSMVIDPADIEANITPRTRAIMGVHLFGRPAPVEELQLIADKHGLHLLYDAAHALGTHQAGRPIGRFGEAEAFSLSPTKLVTAGEGGILTTQSQDIAEVIRTGRNYGCSEDYDCVYPGLSARMTEMQAILGLASLRRLDASVERRNAIATLYRERLGGLPGLSFQSIATEDRSSYKDFTLKIDADHFGLSRDHLKEALRAENIDCRGYFSPPCHQMSAFHRFVRAGNTLSRTERLAERCLSLPIWSGMDLELAAKISDGIIAIHEHAQEIKGALMKTSAPRLKET